MREPVSISIRPDSTIRLNITQLIVIVIACLSGAFGSGASYMKISAHIETSPTAEQVSKLETRVAVLELLCSKGN